MYSMELKSDRMDVSQPVLFIKFSISGLRLFKKGEKEARISATPSFPPECGLKWMGRPIGLILAC